jgi:hypothetical protein
VFFLVSGQLLTAQITTSSLSGTVTNASAEALAGASITAVHQPSGTKYAVVSKSGGRFYIPNMRVGGPYHIEVTFVGFEPQKFDDIYLKLAEDFVLNTTLSSANSTLTNVVISTTGRKNPILNSGRTGAVTNIGRRDIERLPSISRNINDLTRVSPQSNGASIAGGNYRQNNFTIDGSDFNNSFGIGTNLPAGGSPISLDALEEFSVNITPYDVRQSGFIGSAINAVTRSGTNTFSGSVYNYFRTEKQQGNKIKNGTFVRAPFEFKQYGVRIGGPIIKNKLFFFFNYETENQPKLVQTRYAATAATPFGSNSNIARPTRTELDVIHDYLLNTYKYEAGIYDGYSSEIKLTKYLGRIDWNINQNHHFNVRYSQVEGGTPFAPSTSTTGSNWTGFPTGQGRTDNNSLWFKNSNYFQGNNFYSVAAELTSKFGRVANVLRGTYTYQNEARSSESSVFPFVDIMSGGTPFTSFGYEPFTKGNLRQVKMYSFVDNINFTAGKHSVTAGIQADFSKTVNGFQRFATDYYIFNSWNDFISGVKPVNFATTFTFAPNFAQVFPSFKFAQYSAYAQDEIAINKKFKLTLGLRLDQPVYRDVAEIKTNPYILAATFANGFKMNTGVLPQKKLMASPRIGFNYDVYGDRSLQIRGGTGVFTGKIPFVWIVSQSGDNGMLQATIGINGQANTPGPFNPISGSYWPGTVPPAGSVIPSATDALASDFKFPQTWKSSLAMDTKLPWGTIFTLEAIFNKDLKTPYFRNVNLVDPLPLNVAGYPDSRNIYPNANNVKFINPLLIDPRVGTSVIVPNGTVATAPTSISAFNAISLENGSKGYYFSLSAQLQKQFSGGFSAFLSYTKSMAANLFDGSGDQPLSAWQSTASVNGSNYAKLDYAGFVLPDRVSAGVSYKKEYLKHLATTISVFYNGSIDGRFSYVYGADFNRDGFNGNDLIYIPKDASEITFTSFAYPNGVTYSAQEQSDLFFKYIAQDKYLSKHKGQYAERNGAQIPWRNQVDLKFLQDLFVNVGKNRNTIQFSVDIFNFGNLINKNWGVVKTINASSLLVPTNQASLVPGGTVRPTFRLQTDRNVPVTNTFRDNFSIASTYYMQFGLRYLFN